MKQLKIVLSALLLLCAFSSFSLKKENKPVYLFGVSTSFIDTVVYCTDIQLMDSVFPDKNGFLPQRDLYSYQLKNYLEQAKGLKSRTCVIYFSTDKKKIDKEVAKLALRYKKNKQISVHSLSKEEFSFKKPEE